MDNVVPNQSSLAVVKPHSFSLKLFFLFFLSPIISAVFAFVFSILFDIVDSILFDLILHVDYSPQYFYMFYVFFMFVIGIAIGYKHKSRFQEELVIAEFSRFILFFLAGFVFIFIAIQISSPEYVTNDGVIAMISGLSITYGTGFLIVVGIELLGIIIGRKSEYEVRYLHKVLFEHNETQTHRPRLLLIAAISLVSLILGVAMMAPIIWRLNEQKVNYRSLVQDMTGLEKNVLIDKELITDVNAYYTNNALGIQFDMPIGWYYSEMMSLTIDSLTQYEGRSGFIGIYNTSDLSFDNLKQPGSKQITISVGRTRKGLSSFKNINRGSWEYSIIGGVSALKETRTYDVTDYGTDNTPDSKRQEFKRTYYVKDGNLMYSFEEISNTESDFSELDEIVQSVVFRK